MSVFCKPRRLSLRFLVDSTKALLAAAGTVNPQKAAIHSFGGAVATETRFRAGEPGTAPEYRCCRWRAAVAGGRRGSRGHPAQDAFRICRDQANARSVLDAIRFVPASYPETRTGEMCALKRAIRIMPRFGSKSAALMKPFPRFPINDRGISFQHFRFQPFQYFLGMPSAFAQASAASPASRRRSFAVRSECCADMDRFRYRNLLGGIWEVDRRAARLILSNFSKGVPLYRSNT